MDEKAMLEQIRQSAEGIEIPDALKPEAIERKLAQEQRKDGKHRNHYIRFGSMAAAVLALCICAGAVFAVPGMNPWRNTSSDKELSMTEGMQDDKESAGNTVKEKNRKVSLGDTYHLATDYGRVYDMLYAWDVMQQKEDNRYESGDMAQGSADGMDVSNGNVMTEDLEQSSESKREDGDYSQTNLQTAGVDESDIVKTDGDYIYTLTENKVVITDIRDNALTEAGTITPPVKSAADTVCEMYVDEDKLFLIMERNAGNLQPQGATEDAGTREREICVDDVYYMDTNYETVVLTYDISDRSEPKLSGEMVQDGSYHSSRKIEDKIYLFTDYRMDYEGMTRGQALSEERLKEWLPSVADEVVSADCIYLPSQGQSGLVMASMDADEPEEAIDRKLVINHSAEIYVSAEAVYLYTSEYRDREITTIAKFELQDNGIIHAVNASSVNGVITDTFGIHEAGGYLRVLTSEWTQDGEDSNRLTILGKDMEYVSTIEDIARGERIYAARFLGDIGYFVTYRNTDPLFTVDLSDPYAPEIIGELKVTGFSEYLHFWDETHLIGIGYETDAETGNRIGVKLSMFDISDPANVKEEARHVIYGEDDSSAMWNYKSVLISKDKNIIGFVTEDYETEDGVSYRAFSYDNGAFTEELKVSSWEEDFSSWYALNNYRSLYSGHMLYLVGGDKIASYDMDADYAKTKEIEAE